MRGMQIDSVPIKVRALSPDLFDYKIRISINKITHNIKTILYDQFIHHLYFL